MRQILARWWLAFSFLLFFVLLQYCCYQSDHLHQRVLAAGQKTSWTATRKLLGAEERMGEGTCSTEDIALYQGATSPLPNGIPTYTVEVLNVCVSGCAVANIHVSCGWFSSARLINPRIFRRLSFDDCLVNDGAALAAGESLSFQYANTFRYPLAVSSVSCL